MVDFYKASIVAVGIIACLMGFVPIGLAFVALGLWLFVALKPVDNAFDNATNEGDTAGQARAIGLGGLVFAVAVVAFVAILLSYAMAV